MEKETTVERWKRNRLLHLWDLERFLMDLSRTSRNGHNLERQFRRGEMAVEGEGTVCVRARSGDSAGTFEKLQADGGYYLKQQNLHHYLGSGEIPSEVWNGHKWTTIDLFRRLFLKEQNSQNQRLRGRKGL